MTVNLSPVLLIRTGISFPSRFRDPAPQGLHKQLMVRQSDSRPRDGEITPSKQVKFSETISSIEINDPDMEGHLLGIDPSPEWSSRSSPYTADNHVSSYSPYQSPVHDESFSSSSEGINSTIISLSYAVSIALH